MIWLEKGWIIEYFYIENLVFWAMPVPHRGGQSSPALPEETP